MMGYTERRLWSPQLLALVLLLSTRVEAVHHRERTAAARKMHSSYKYRASGGRAAVQHQHVAPAQKDFVYIYDMPSEFNEDLRDLPV
ncbi:hypothetical protein COCSUDRAFT_33176, partial [Coccomyxa subellipsoidea C-169]